VSPLQISDKQGNKGIILPIRQWGYYTTNKVIRVLYYQLLTGIKIKCK
jgi:hypothetical protein